MLMRRLPLVHDDGPLVCRVSAATNSYMDVSHPRFALALSSPADLEGVELEGGESAQSWGLSLE